MSMLKVNCPSCDAPYEMDTRRLPERGIKMRCPKCGHSFWVTKDGVSAGPSMPPAGGKTMTGTGRSMRKRTMIGVGGASDSPFPPVDGSAPSIPPQPSDLGELDFMSEPPGAGAADLALDLPSPKRDFDLPAPKSNLDLPAPKSNLDLPAPKSNLDLPAPKSNLDLPTPKSNLDLPSPKKGADLSLDLPIPKSGGLSLDLPSPRDHVGLPAAKGGSTELDLPISKSGASGLDLELDSPSASFGDTDLSLDLPVSKKPPAADTDLSLDLPISKKPPAKDDLLLDLPVSKKPPAADTDLSLDLPSSSGSSLDFSGDLSLDLPPSGVAPSMDSDLSLDLPVAKSSASSDMELDLPSLKPQPPAPPKPLAPAGDKPTLDLTMFGDTSGDDLELDLPSPKGKVPAVLGGADLPTPRHSDFPDDLGLMDDEPKRGTPFDTFRESQSEVGGGTREISLDLGGDLADGLELDLPAPRHSDFPELDDSLDLPEPNAERMSNFEVDLGDDDDEFDDLDDLELPDPVDRGGRDSDDEFGDIDLGDDEDEGLEFEDLPEEAGMGLGGGIELDDDVRGSTPKLRVARRISKKRKTGLILTALGLLAIFGGGVALSFTEYGLFGWYFVERYLPEAGSPESVKSIIANAERAGADDTFGGSREMLKELGNARKSKGLNRALLARSVMHEAMFQVRFGGRRDSKARIEAISKRLEKRGNDAYGIEQAQAARALQDGAISDAIRDARKASQKFGDDPFVDLISGHAFLKNKKVKEAKKSFAAAVRKGAKAAGSWGLVEAYAQEYREVAAKRALYINSRFAEGKPIALARLKNVLATKKDEEKTSASDDSATVEGAELPPAGADVPPNGSEVDGTKAVANQTGDEAKSDKENAGGNVDDSADSKDSASSKTAKSDGEENIAENAPTKESATAKQTDTNTVDGAKANVDDAADEEPELDAMDAQLAELKVKLDASIAATLKASPRHADALIESARFGWRGAAEQEALSTLEQVARLAPRNGKYLATSSQQRAEALTLLGDIHEQRGRRSRARIAYERAIEADPYDARGLLGAGRMLLEERRYSDAQARFETAEHSAGDDAAGKSVKLDAGVGIAQALYYSDQPQDALSRLQGLTKSNPNAWNIYLWIGKTHELLKAEELAEANYRKSIELGPHYFDGYFALSQFFSKTERPDEAAKTLADAQSHVEMNAYVRRTMGEAELRLNNVKKARDFFAQALELSPDDTAAKFGLGVALRRLGELDLADKQFLELVEVDPGYPGLSLERGRIYEAKGNPDAAVVSYEQALKRNPNDNNLLLRLGAAQVLAGQIDAASETLRKFHEQGRETAEGEYFSGRVDFAQHSLDKASQRFVRAIQLDGTNAEFHVWLARAQLDMNRLGASLEAVRSALDRDPLQGDAFWVRGRIRVRGGVVRDAIRDFEKALTLNPSRFEAYVGLAEAYEQLGDRGKAIAHYESALKEDPKRGDWWFDLGRVRLDAEQSAAALEAAKQAASLGDEMEKPGGWHFRAHRLAGDIHRLLGQSAEAVVHYKKAYEASESSPREHRELEQALTDLGAPPVVEEEL